MAKFEYLDRLIKEVNDLRKEVDFYEIDVSSCTISYMPTKKTSFVGYKEGYYDKLIQAEKGMKESDKLRATVKSYLKYIKKDGKLICIELHNDGRIDCLFQVYWNKNKRYLFPFSANGGYYSTYTYVTVYEGNFVSEEYMVQGSQIVYEAYSNINDTEIDYRRVNYVSGGKYPVLEASKGKLHLDPLSYEEAGCDNWLNHR